MVLAPSYDVTKIFLIFTIGQSCSYLASSGQEAVTLPAFSAAIWNKNLV